MIYYYPIISSLGLCSPRFYSTVSLYASNNVALVYYPSNQYQHYFNSQNTFMAVEILSYIVLFLSIIPAKIVAIELFGVLQLAYFCLANLDQVNVVLSPLMGMNSLNGYNIMQSDSSAVPSRVGSLDYSSTFLSNCNIMLLLILILTFVGVVFLALGFIFAKFSETFFSISKYILKQFLLGLVLFNIFNLSFSVSLHLLYANSSQPSYSVSTFLVVAVIILLGTMGVALLFT